MLMAAAVCFTALALLCLLWSERMQRPRGVARAKPLASLGFVAVAVLGGALHTVYGRVMLAGLVLCALGDVLLIPAGRGLAFLSGLACFALGHAAYASAFCLWQPALPAALVAGLGMLVVAGATLRWLGPHLPADFVWPVRVYVAVISVMVAFSAGASWTSGDARMLAGAAAFAASDLSVARERFVKPGFDNLIWGLPLYYVAQLVLACAAARPA